MLYFTNPTIPRLLSVSRSQRGDWDNFRNDLFDGEPMRFPAAGGWVAPRQGLLCVDYVSPFHPVSTLDRRLMLSTSEGRYTRGLSLALPHVRSIRLTAFFPFFPKTGIARGEQLNTAKNRDNILRYLTVKILTRFLVFRAAKIEFRF